jgi:hypothetical protein
MNDFHEFISTPRRLLMERQTQAPGQWPAGTRLSLAIPSSALLSEFEILSGLVLRALPD